MSFRRCRTVWRRKEGFALLSVLVLIAIVSSVAIVMLTRSRDDLREMMLVERALRAKIHADNGILRAVTALSEPTDVLHAALLIPGNIVRWRDQAVEILLLVEHESGKVDLNHADPRLIRGAIQQLGLQPDAASVLEKRIETFRRSESFIHDFRQVLSPSQVLDRTGSRAERLFTLATGARGLAPSGMPARNFVIFPELSTVELSELRERPRGSAAQSILARYRDLTSPWRPAFTIRVEVADPVLPPVKRKAGLVFRQIPVQWREDIHFLFWEHDNWPVE